MDKLRTKRTKLNDKLDDLDRKHEAEISVYNKYEEADKKFKAEKYYKINREIVSHQLISIQEEIDEWQNKLPKYYVRTLRS